MTGARQGRRIAARFSASFASFLLLAAAGAYVYFNAVDRQLLKPPCWKNVDYAALGMDADSMRSSREETILFPHRRRTAGNPKHHGGRLPGQPLHPSEFPRPHGYGQGLGELLLALLCAARWRRSRCWPQALATSGRRADCCRVLRRNDSAAAAHCRGGPVGQPGLAACGDAAPHAYPRRHFPADELVMQLFGNPVFGLPAARPAGCWC